jgi:hypothetical protein
MILELNWDDVGPYITVLSFLLLTAVVTIGIIHPKYQLHLKI